MYFICLFCERSVVASLFLSIDIYINGYKLIVDKVGFLQFFEVLP